MPNVVVLLNQPQKDLPILQLLFGIEGADKADRILSRIAGHHIPGNALLSAATNQFRWSFFTIIGSTTASPYKTHDTAS
jgi:hypothetical protein